MLSVLADTRDQLRQVAKDTFQIDPAVDPNKNITLARPIVAWEAATQSKDARAKKEAISPVENEPKSLPMSEYLGVRKRFEQQYYALREEEIPSKFSLEDMQDQLESGDWRAMSLKEVASRADVDAETHTWGSLTVGKEGDVKVKKSAVETPAPKDLEEFRQKLKLLGHHFVFLRMLNPNRKELGDVNPFTFSSYSDYMLSRRVARLEAEDEKGTVLHTPSLQAVLTYDFYVRKKAVELLAADKPLAAALKSAQEDSVVKERRFTTPLSVSAASQSVGAARSRSPPVHQSASSASKGPGQKGKKGNKGKNKGKGRGGLFSLTPDGRQICYAYNSQYERCNGSCGRAHVCQMCMGPHPLHMHASETKKTEGGGTGTTPPASTKWEVVGGLSVLYL